MGSGTHSAAGTNAGLADPQSADGVRCWRCMDTPDEVRERDHPDPTIDARVPVCADGCWLPEDIVYRCHNCDETHGHEAVHLVWLPNRSALAPECLDCNRALSG